MESAVRQFSNEYVKYYTAGILGRLKRLDSAELAAGLLLAITKGAGKNQSMGAGYFSAAVSQFALNLAAQDMITTQVLDALNEYLVIEGEPVLPAQSLSIRGFNVKKINFIGENTKMPVYNMDNIVFLKRAAERGVSSTKVEGKVVEQGSDVHSQSAAAAAQRADVEEEEEDVVDTTGLKNMRIGNKAPAKLYQDWKPVPNMSTFGTIALRGEDATKYLRERFAFCNIITKEGVRAVGFYSEDITSAFKSFNNDKTASVFSEKQWQVRRYAMPPLYPAGQDGGQPVPKPIKTVEQNELDAFSDALDKIADDEGLKEFKKEYPEVKRLQIVNSYSEFGTATRRKILEEATAYFVQESDPDDISEEYDWQKLLPVKLPVAHTQAEFAKILEFVLANWHEQCLDVDLWALKYVQKSAKLDIIATLKSIRRYWVSIVAYAQQLGVVSNKVLLGANNIVLNTEIQFYDPEGNEISATAAQVITYWVQKGILEKVRQVVPFVALILQTMTVNQGTAFGNDRIMFEPLKRVTAAQKDTVAQYFTRRMEAIKEISAEAKKNGINKMSACMETLTSMNTRDRKDVIAVLMAINAEPLFSPFAKDAGAAVERFAISLGYHEGE